MKCDDLTEGVGRITKQNQTVDVGPNQISIEAGKFGNKVDKDGRPATIGKKVKGSSTNVLFNLGLTESSITKGIQAVEGALIPNPKNTFLTKADTAYDHYKLGTNMANLKTVKKGANYDEPDVIVAPYAGKKEMKYLMKQLKRIGYDVQDAQGYQDTHFDDQPTGGEEPPQIKDTGKLGKIKVSSLVPVQKNRSYDKLAKQFDKVENGNYSPLTIDPKGRIVNGHHRYDALRILGLEYAVVRMMGSYLEETMDACDPKKNLAEALGEISKNIEIYVDMDGVLADFFGEWSKSQGVDNWKQIDDPAKAIGKIKDIDDFWLNLPVLPKAKSLLSLIKQVKGSYKICTSPLADDPRSEPHKREWVKKNLDFFPPEKVIVTHNKPQFATQPDGTPNILIDDYGVNIEAWEKAGGIGFKYKDYKFNRTAKAIKQKMDAPIEENLIEKEMDCPPATQDLELNTKNRDATLKNFNYGPLNVSEPGDYWEKIAEYWKTDVKAAKASNCGNCVAFDISPRMDDCMPGETSDEDGRLGYCWMHHFKCHSARSCHTWAKGGPIEDDDKSHDWQERGEKESIEEGYKLHLERDDDLMVLHIVDTKSGKRTEVRGKPGYERGNYDANDKLHKLLDTVGKSANIAELINGEVVTINPKHPDAERAKKATDVAYNENFADGKKKGKSRPGRVKRSGASCKGSVTKLRARAKKASGEKAKMYHWCANMKSGKKK